MNPASQERGLFASVRRLFGTTLEIALVRLEILGTEVEIEKRRLFDGLFWGASALLALGLGLALLCGFVLLLFWDTYRLTAMSMMAFIFLALSLVLLRTARRRLQSANGMFEASLTELRRDVGGIEAPQKNEHG